MKKASVHVGFSHRRWMTMVLLLLMTGQVAAQQKHCDGIDDALQYIPYSVVIGLKACGVGSCDDWTGLLVSTATSWVVSAGTAYVLKHSVKEWRPDDSDQKSFPSGHAAFAFAGATMLCLEYGHISPWIPVAGYGVATLTAVDRIMKERHHWYDVATGAGIGFFSAELAYYLTHKWLKSDKVAMAFTGNRIDVALCW